ncbi:MAG: ABC transporter permease [Erysipelothrix sp.]|nr:ABC transporter permease [Erysipelothrix sp.]
MARFIINVLEQGSLYAILSIAVMLTYKIIGMADMSVDGTYPLGAVVSAVFILNGGNPWVSLIVAAFSGVLAGCMTGVLHVKLRISSLLSGILVMTGLYSVNLIIAGGRSNLSLLNDATLFDVQWLVKFKDAAFFGFVEQYVLPYYRLIVLVMMVLLIKWAVDWLLQTKLGYLLRVTGDNESLVVALGHDVGKVKIIALAISNGLAALSGAVAASVGRYYDVSLGTGMVVMGLSSVMLGTLLMKKSSVKMTSMVILGSILYRFIVALAIRLGMDPQHMKLITVVIFVVAIVLNNASLSLTFMHKKGEV